MTTYVFQFFADSRATANSSPAQQWSLIRPACHKPSLLTVHAPDPNRPSHRVLEAPPGFFDPPEQQSQPDARQDRPQTRQRDKSRSRRRSRSRNQVRKHRDRTSRERRGRGRRDDRHAKRHRKRSRQGRCRSRSLPRQPTLPPNTPEPPGHPGHPRHPGHPATPHQAAARNDLLAFPPGRFDVPQRPHPAPIQSHTPWLTSRGQPPQSIFFKNRPAQPPASDSKTSALGYGPLYHHAPHRATPLVTANDKRPRTPEKKDGCSKPAARFLRAACQAGHAT